MMETKNGQNMSSGPPLDIFSVKREIMGTWQIRGETRQKAPKKHVNFNTSKDWGAWSTQFNPGVLLGGE